jgi:hypothetical protein
MSAFDGEDHAVNDSLIALLIEPLARDLWK